MAEPERRPTFKITLSFTDFSGDRLGQLDREALAEAIFEHLVQGPVDPDGPWSIDGYEVERDDRQAGRGAD